MSRPSPAGTLHVVATPIGNLNDLSPRALDLMVDDKLVKLDAHLIEFFVFNAMLALFQHRLNYPHWWRIGFKVDDLLIPIQSFPTSVVPQRSRRRAYLSGVLSRNEITRSYAYNRRLFVRTAHGFYVLNPAASLRVGERWVALYDLLYPPQLDRHTNLRSHIENILAFNVRYAADPEAAMKELLEQVEKLDDPAAMA